jgi:predicted alpha/beta hydrolase
MSHTTQRARAVCGVGAYWRTAQCEHLTLGMSAMHATVGVVVIAPGLTVGTTALGVRALSIEA